MRWIALFVLLPALELALLIEIGRHMGTAATLALIAVTGVVGAVLARRQGLQVLGRVQAELNEGRLPAGPMVDGLLILLAAAVLLTPGILTDAFGFLCLVPLFRQRVRRELLRRLERAAREGRVVVYHSAELGGPPSWSREEIDVTPDSDEERSGRTLH